MIDTKPKKKLPKYGTEEWKDFWSNVYAKKKERRHMTLAKTTPELRQKIRDLWKQYTEQGIQKSYGDIAVEVKLIKYRERKYATQLISYIIKHEESQLRKKESHNKIKRLKKYSIPNTNKKIQDYKNTIQTRLHKALHHRIFCVLKKESIKKDMPTLELVGCDTSFFKLHIESQFRNKMNWNNYGCRKGQWSLDHIIAISKFDLTKREDTLIAFNWRNIRPLWVSHNSSKHNNLPRNHLVIRKYIIDELIKEGKL